MQRASNFVIPSSGAAAATSNYSIDGLGKYYLPAVLANRKAAQVGLIDLDRTKCSDGRYLYTYKVNWKEDIKEVAAKMAKDADFMEMLKHDRLEQLPPLPSPSQQSGVRKRNLGVPVSSALQKQSRRCDGPCHRRLPVEELKTIGLCEHVACQQCLQTAPRVEASFGGFGCPNNKCYLLDMAALCPDKKKRMEQIRRAYALKSPLTTSMSQASYVAPGAADINLRPNTVSLESFRLPPPVAASSVLADLRVKAKSTKHMVTANVAVFSSDQNGADFLSKYRFEYLSDQTLGFVVESIMNSFPNLKGKNLDCRCFLGPQSYLRLFDRSLWTPINTFNAADKLHALEDENMKIMIVVDVIGYSI